MNENDSNQQPATYQAVRIGDIADWHLLACISADAMTAWLKHSDPSQPVVPLLSCRWNVKDENLLDRIESAVYDNPQILDDFSADIVVVTPHTLLVPSESVDDDDEEAVRLFNRVYCADESDIMMSGAGEATAIFSLTPGLKGFLQRTFPGARIHSHLGLMAERLRDRSYDVPRLYIDIRPDGGDENRNEGEADFVAFDCRNLVMAASHRWSHPDDIKYHLFNIMQVFGLDPAKIQVSISGSVVFKNALVQELRQDIAYVVMTLMPGMAVKAGMPLPLSLLLRK